MPDLFTDSGATFSPCRAFRYRLWRRWSDGPAVNFVLLNPSTADETRNDPTIERCERRARQWGHGALVVTNLFALRATNPARLRWHGEPIGPENDRHILEAAREASLVVCGWGAWGSWLRREFDVIDALLGAGIVLHALEVTATGAPRHPLYLPYTAAPTVWRAPESRR